LGYKAKWEYFRTVYERYRKAGREAKQVMLNEFCLNTGYHRKYAIRLSERTSSWKASGAAPARTTAALWPASALHPGGDLGSGWISLVGAAEGFAAQLDALDSQVLPDDPALGFYSLQRRLQVHSSLNVVLHFASCKYVDPLLRIFGVDLLFPREFVGRGDMSRGGLMLRCAQVGLELDHVSVQSAIRRGPRPPKLSSSMPVSPIVDHRAG
jgi:hypothetical protein